MGEFLTGCVGARVVVVMGSRPLTMIQCATEAARDEVLAILGLARFRLVRTADLPPDRDEPDFPDGLFNAWVEHP